jgi:hypothetical protein
MVYSATDSDCKNSFHDVDYLVFKASFKEERLPVTDNLSSIMA